MDGGSSLNILYAHTLRLMGIGLDQLRPSTTSFHAILGRPCYAKFMAVPNYTYLMVMEHAEALALDEALVASMKKLVNEDLDSTTKHADNFEAAEQTKEVPLDPTAPEGKALRVSSTLNTK
jgi:hypothetical protein